MVDGAGAQAVVDSANVHVDGHMVTVVLPLGPGCEIGAAEVPVVVKEPDFAG